MIAGRRCGSLSRDGEAVANGELGLCHAHVLGDRVRFERSLRMLVLPAEEVLGEHDEAPLVVKERFHVARPPRLDK
eukprot:6668376-Prymnesium_polylepis.1